MATQRRNHVRIVRIALDVALSVCFVAGMATALVQEAPHEYLGIATCALTVAHIVTNRRRIAALVRGRKTVRSVALIAVDVAMIVCVIAMLGSALVLSKHAFWFLPALPGSTVARRVHMACSYWLFVLVYAHAGMHMRVWNKCRSAAGKAVTATVLVAVTTFGVWSFVDLQMASYLLLHTQFAFADAAKPLALSFAQYASIGAAIAAVVSLGNHGSQHP